MGKSTVFSGKNVKTLKKSLSLFDQAYVMADDYDPRDTATDAPPSSLFLQYREIIQNLGGTLQNFSGDGNRGLSGTNVDVQAMALNEADNILYLYGLFTEYNNVPVSRLIAIDLGTKELVPGFNVASTTISIVRDMIYIPSTNYLYVVGDFTSFNSVVSGRIVALNADTGAVIPGFGGTGASSSIFTIEYSPLQDLLYVGGIFSSFDGASRAKIAAIDPLTGAVDTGFDPGVGFGIGEVHDIEMESGETALFCAGNFNSYQSTFRNGVVKLDAANASIDLTFDTTSGVTIGSTVYRCVRHPVDNYIYICGSFTTYKSVNNQKIAKISTVDASLDPTFGISISGNFLLGTATEIEYNADNNILYVAGAITAYNTSANPRGGFLALNPTTGEEFVGFNAEPAFSTSSLNAVVRYYPSQGGVLVAGSMRSFGVLPAQGIAKINATSGAAITFLTEKLGFSGLVDGIAVDSVNKILYAIGNFRTYDLTYSPRIAAIDLTTKQYLTGFNVGSGFNVTPDSIIFEPSKNALYVGIPISPGASYNGVLASSVVKLNATTGARDFSFNPGSGANTGTVTALNYNPSLNLLYVGGNFTTFNSWAASRIVSLDADTGAVNVSFTSSPAVDTVGSFVTSFALDEGNNVLYVGGSFTSYQANSSPRLAAVNATTGTFLPGFNVGTGFNTGSVSSLLLDSVAGKLYAGGSFSTYNGSSRNGIAAINTSNGSINTTFNPGSGFASLGPVYLDFNDDKSKIYASTGNSTQYNGFSINGVAAVSSTNAVYDPSFVGGSSLFGFSSIVVLGNIAYAGGSFRDYDANIQSEGLIGIPTGVSTPIPQPYVDLFVKQDAGSTTNWKSLLSQDITVVSSNTTLPLTPNQIIAVSGNTTITLPNMTDLSDLKGLTIVVKKTDTVATDAIIDGNGFNIDGSPTFTLTQQYESVNLVFSGTEWLVF